MTGQLTDYINIKEKQPSGCFFLFKRIQILDAVKQFS